MENPARTETLFDVMRKGHGPVRVSIRDMRAVGMNALRNLARKADLPDIVLPIRGQRGAGAS